MNPDLLRPVFGFVLLACFGVVVAEEALGTRKFGQSWQQGWWLLLIGVGIHLAHMTVRFLRAYLDQEHSLLAEAEWALPIIATVVMIGGVFRIGDTRRAYTRGSTAAEIREFCQDANRKLSALSGKAR